MIKNSHAAIRNTVYFTPLVFFFMLRPSFLAPLSHSYFFKTQVHNLYSFVIDITSLPSPHKLMIQIYIFVWKITHSEKLTHCFVTIALLWGLSTEKNRCRLYHSGKAERMKTKNTNNNTEFTRPFNYANICSPEYFDCIPISWSINW